MHVRSADGGYRNVTLCKHRRAKFIWVGISLALCAAFLFPIGSLGTDHYPIQCKPGTRGDV